MSTPKCLFFQDFQGLTEVFAPGRPPGYPRGRPRDVRPQNLLFGLLFRPWTKVTTQKPEWQHKVGVTAGRTPKIWTKSPQRGTQQQPEDPLTEGPSARHPDHGRGFSGLQQPSRSRTLGERSSFEWNDTYCPRRSYYWINSRRAGPVIFKTFLLELIALRLIPVISPRRGKPENYWKN